MLTVAKDVKAGVVFNTDYVESFRLIGYENKQMTEDEFNDSAKDAGELGSGHTVTVVYEIKLTEKAFTDGDKLADVTVRYKTTENSGGVSEESSELTLPILTDHYHAEATEHDLFIASVVEFTLILRDSAYKGNADLNALITRLDNLTLTDPFKAEFRELVKKYRSNIGD